MINPLIFLRYFLSLLASAGLILLSLLVVFVLLDMIMYRWECYTFWQATYLSAITSLTIGYGDITPHTWEGRLAAIGLGFVGIVLTGVVVAASIKALEKAGA